MVAGPSGCRPVGSFCAPLSVSSSDEASTTSPHQNPNGGRGVQAFMSGIIGPFMACWQPPITSCVSPVSPYGSGCMGQAVSPGSPDSRMAPASPRPTTNISKPHPNDVLCGRGGATNSHVGNLNFRALVSANKGVYVTLTKKQKMLMARGIVSTVHRQEPSGRFLQKDPDSGLWFDIGVPRSLEKTSQALREKTAADKAAASAVDDRDGSEAGTRTPEMNTPNNSAPSSPVSTPVRSHRSRSSNSSVEAPEIIIPDHLEAQFNPQLARRRMAYQDYPPHRSPQQQPYLPNFGPDPRKSADRVYSRGYMHPGGGPPPPPPPPPHMYQPPPHYRGPDYRAHRPLRRSVGPPPPPPPSSRMPPPQPHHPYPHKSMHHAIPPSPTSSSVVTPDYGSPPRRGGAPDVSPGRRQEWKRRRASEDATAIRVPDGRPSSDAGSASSLHQDMANRLSFQERSHHGHQGDGNSHSSTTFTEHMTSPTSVLQSRASRRLSSQEQQGLAGLAALSSAALLKLDEGD